MGHQPASHAVVIDIDPKQEHFVGIGIPNKYRPVRTDVIEFQTKVKGFGWVKIHFQDGEGGAFRDGVCKFEGIVDSPSELYRDSPMPTFMFRRLRQVGHKERKRDRSRQRATHQMLRCEENRLFFPPFERS